MRMVQKLLRSWVLRRAEAEADFVVKRKAVALRSELHRRALLATADFIQANMTSALMCQSRLEHLSFLAPQIKPGMILEFGVYSGVTINHLARLFPDRTLHGFDSFQGLPEAWHGYRYSKENFDLAGRMPKVAANVQLVPGWFDQTLPKFLAEHAGPVALAHVDCDIYSSTVTVLELLRPRLQPGSILAFDEFFNYPSYPEHEMKAFFEFVARHRVKFSYLGYAAEQASVRLDEFGSS